MVVENILERTNLRCTLEVMQELVWSKYSLKPVSVRVAFAPSTMIIRTTDKGDVIVERGDAILRDGEGKITVVGSMEFAEKWERTK
jgi:hypothetical protein